jgi:hypothetical protein
MAEESIPGAGGAFGFKVIAQGDLLGLNSRFMWREAAGTPL